MPDPEQIARFTADLAALGVRDGDRLAVAVSGGPDSLALLLLAAGRGDAVAATVNHGLRAEAIDEAAMVAEVCGKLGVRHETLNVRVSDHGQGLQAEARRVRYHALERWAGRVGAAAIATAHHADDQAETFLMRAARGAGVAGLAGVRRQRGGGALPVVRPVLFWRRQALALLVSRAGLTPVTDPSNDDDRFDRTLVRRMLAREESVLRPERIAASAAYLAGAEEALGWAAAKAFAERVVGEEDDADGDFTLDPAGLPHELLRRIVHTTLCVLDERLTRGSSAWEPRGPDVARLVARVVAGEVSTLGGIKVTPGPLWRFSAAPPHRSG